LNLPEGFIETVPIPQNEITDFQESLNLELKPSFRVNPYKAEPALIFEKVPWCPTAYYLDQRPRFTSNPPFHAGAFYPQEASSMFISHLLRELSVGSEPILALDLCAAPGGKTTLLQSELHKNSLIHANETIQSRFAVLAENTTKWGVPNICISNNDPSDFRGIDDFYDLILVDAPCSGEGLFRKQHDAVNHWSPKAVEHCSARQRRILGDIWPSLKEGGILIYSTCTYNRLENEENLKWLSAQGSLEFLDVNISQYPGIQKVEEEGIKGYRFFPHKVQGEGFFCSAVRKNDGKRAKSPKLKRRNLKVIDQADRFSLMLSGDSIYAGQNDQFEHLEFLVNHFRKSLKPGIEIGKMMRESTKYEHGMAMLSPNQDFGFDSTNLNLHNSLRYLKKEDISLKLATGRLLVQFDGFTLGFAKSDSRRLISQYPKNWRILNAREEEYTPLVRSLK
jgi:16S rRNA C967 or C1407 C5-methylase (RsmB/RsmF family)/NOL1/NOP2/fmu family ribosome biogenesis protein